MIAGEVLRLLSKPKISGWDGTPKTVSTSDYLEVFKVLFEANQSPLSDCVKEVMLSLLETDLLCDPELQLLCTYWKSRYQNAETVIGGRLRELFGVDPPERLIASLKKCISGAAAQRGRGRREHRQHMKNKLQELIENSSNGELRCESCGYHFRLKDLGTIRKLVVRLGFKLAKTIHPGRNEDRFKPLWKNDGRTSITEFTVDHVVPEETLGWSTHDNLQVLCRFCNEGKQAYRRALEAISVFAVGGLCNFPRNRKSNQLQKTIACAAIRATNGECSISQAKVNECELTVLPRFNEWESSVSFFPWDLHVLSYEELSTLLNKKGVCADSNFR